MKRRSFLGMFGAALATPALPAIANISGYSRAAYARALIHAKTRHHLSARGIAHCLGVPRRQAEGMIAEMTKSGLVRPVTGGAGVHVRATSNIVKSSAIGLRDRRDTARRTHRSHHHSGSTQDALLRHLHGICRRYGIEPTPRAIRSLNQ